jgi:hypothetical protein
VAKYKCKNFGSCSIADGGKDFEVALGGDDRCPECGITLAPSQVNEAASKHSKNTNIVLIGIAVAALILAGLGYAWWSRSKVVVLVPDQPTAPTVGSAAAASSPEQTMPAASTAASGAVVDIKVSEVKPSELNVGEVISRQACDEATRAKSPDAAKVCRRAAAVTLLNSGAQAAVAGNLEQAEKDYLTAKDKDPDIPELYFNIAVLKARQGKSPESVDNLRLAEIKGFKRFDLIASEPAFAKIKADPELKAKIDALLPK